MYHTKPRPYFYVNEFWAHKRYAMITSNNSINNNKRRRMKFSFRNSLVRFASFITGKRIVESIVFVALNSITTHNLRSLIPFSAKNETKKCTKPQIKVFNLKCWQHTKRFLFGIFQLKIVFIQIYK